MEIARVASRLKSAGIASSERVRVHFVEHHRAHLASAFFASPFDEAALGQMAPTIWSLPVGTDWAVDHNITHYTQSLEIDAYGEITPCPKNGPATVPR